MIKIGVPQKVLLSKNEGGNVTKKARIVCNIELEGIDHEIWYEVNEKYGEYLCFERIDAFLLGILPFALAKGENICSQGKISEKLYFQLTSFLIPALVQYSNYYKPVIITGELDDTVYSYGKAVGTGFSAGVDSFYTILNNWKSITKNFNISHLTFFNVGAAGGYGGAGTQKLYEERIELIKSFAYENKFEFVTVDSNISEYVKMNFEVTHTFRSLSAVLALQKLFNIYYYSSGVTLDEFSFNYKSSSFYDLLNMECFSTENLSFYCTGVTETRMQKVDFISQFPETFKYLNVCADKAENCGRCSKCIRTMSELYSLNKLELYKNVFNLEDYFNNLNYNLGWIFANKYAALEDFDRSFSKEIIDRMKKNNLNIPFTARVRAIPIMLKNSVIILASKNKPLKRWWHKRIAKKNGAIYADI
jgi:bacterioferritin-associated ferredoxin